MELKDQVCSLELAQKLKELGVKQNSLFKYVFSYSENVSFKPKIYYNICYNNGGTVSAFTVAELWRCFPVYIGDYFLTIKMYGDNLFYVSYRNDKENLENIAFVEKNGADALARMLIYLLENNYVKVEDINE